MLSINTIQEFFIPASVVIIGASQEKGRIGSGLYKSLFEGFAGPVYLVNPNYQRLWDRPCYGSVKDLPAVPSHAIIAVARQHVLKALKDCIDIGIRHVVVISSGFKEKDAAGALMEQEITDICRASGTVLLGPNTLGFINTALSYNGTFLPDRFEQGPVSIISQSGGVGMALLAALKDQRCGIAKWVGIGNESVLETNALLQYLAQDPETKVIAVCFEGLKDLPGFLRLASELRHHKPIVLLRDGKSAAGIAAAASHTGMMAQSDQVITGLIRQHGLLEAQSVRECAVMLKALARAPLPSGTRTAILTNTAGPAILAADVLQPAGIGLPLPSPELVREIDRQTGWDLDLKNPADISSYGLMPKVYGETVKALLDSDEYDILLAMFSLNPHLSLPDRELIMAARRSKKPIIACFLSSFQDFLTYAPVKGMETIPCYYDPQDAAWAVRALAFYRQRPPQDKEHVPGKLSGRQKQAVSDYINSIPAKGCAVLPERTSREILSLAGADNFIPLLVESESHALAAAQECGYPVVLKVHSEQITHKSDAGGVRVDLKNPQELIQAYQQMSGRVFPLDPDARFTVQPMAEEGFELILGAVRTPATGPMVMAGAGGIYAEILKDAQFRLVPLKSSEAIDLLGDLKCAPILNGSRGRELDNKAAAGLLAIISDLMDTFPELQEIDVNPCRVYPNGIALLDARIILDKSGALK